MLLIGSKALECYLNLGRVTHDWDIYMSEQEYTEFYTKYSKNLVKETKHSSIFEIDRELFEIKRESQFTETDKLLYYTDYAYAKTSILGILRVPTVLDLYHIKRATANHIQEPKHKYDIELMEREFPHFKMYNSNSYLYTKRDLETKTRIENEKKVKYDFFHKYHIPEYIVHDKLHDMIASLLDIKMPTYQRITVAETDIAEECFNRLTHEQKISLMVEESLVLNLERWFIPRMVEDGINYKLVEMFYNNNEAMPTYLILKHCCITGLKGEAEYITNFSRKYFFEIEKAWQEAKYKIRCKNGFTKEFYNELFELRKKYKAGEKVGTI